MAGVGGSPLAPRDHRAPGRGPIAPSGPDRAPIAPSGPDRAPIAPSPDQGAIAQSLLALLYKVTTRHPQQNRGSWEGVVLLGISPELILFLGGISVCLPPKIPDQYQK